MKFLFEFLRAFLTRPIFEEYEMSPLVDQRKLYLKGASFQEIQNAKWQRGELNHVKI